MPDLVRDLGLRQQRFVEEYLLDLNAKQAAIRAGYSPKTAEAQGSRLLSNLKVQRALTARIAARSQRTEIAADRALLEIARIWLLGSAPPVPPGRPPQASPRMGR